MKLSVLGISLVMAASLVSCGGVSDKHDDIKQLKDVKGEWTKDQTNQAIDIYIQGLNEQADNYEKIFLIGEKDILKEYKCDEEALKARKDEIKEVQQAVSDKRKEIEKKYKDED